MMDEYECIKLEGEGRREDLCPVVVETPLSIFINGRHFATAMISPALREEFVVGHLYSERIISGRQELESLEVEG
ncbi:MAG: formate dehydrogenase accessory sulfurtransferase FdhD, partial [Methanothrix sp.]|nr:formate dehydrogenase accessory sulfurtransferase FdhD [Methanothrix sp.]